MFSLLFATAETMSWEGFAQAWGPAVPVFLAFMWLLDKYTKMLIHRGFKSVTDAIAVQSEKAEVRHKETVDMLQAVLVQLPHRNGHNRGHRHT